MPRQKLEHSQHPAGFYALPDNNPVQKPGDMLPGGSNLTGQAILGQVEPNSGGKMPNPPAESGKVTGYRSSKTPVPVSTSGARKEKRRYSVQQRKEAATPLQRPEPRKKAYGGVREVPV